jgi:hypothetical protein
MASGRDGGPHRRRANVSLACCRPEGEVLAAGTAPPRRLGRLRVDAKAAQEARICAEVAGDRQTATTAAGPASSKKPSVGPVASTHASRTAIVAPLRRGARPAVSIQTENQSSLKRSEQPVSGPDRSGAWPLRFPSERGRESRLSVTGAVQSRSVSAATCWVASAHWHAPRQTRRGPSVPRSQATCVGTYRSSSSGPPMPGQRPELDPP